MRYYVREMPAASEAEIFDESGLVAKAREGDSSAFNELVNRYSRKIYRLAKHITQNDEDAEDVLQETFLKAFSHLDSFQGQSKFYTWIVRIAVNEALMKLRKRKSDRSVPLDEPLDTGEDTVVREIAVWDENAFIDSGIYGTDRTPTPSRQPIGGPVAAVHTLRKWTTDNAYGLQRPDIGRLSPKELWTDMHASPLSAVRPGQVFGLIGPSGAGKSTLLRSLNRLNDLVPGLQVSGDVLLHGKSVKRLRDGCIGIDNWVRLHTRDDRGHAEIQDRTQRQRAENADRYVALGPLRLLGVRRNCVETDVRKENGRGGHHDAGDSVRHERTAHFFVQSCELAIEAKQADQAPVSLQARQLLDFFSRPLHDLARQRRVLLEEFLTAGVPKVRLQQETGEIRTVSQ